MVLRNWYNAVKAFRAGVVIPRGLNGASDMGYYHSGNYWSTLSTLRYSSVIWDTNNSGILLGKGTTKATIDDVRLDSQITTGLSVSVSTSVDDNYDRVLSLLVTNNSSEPITIGEIGMQGWVYTGNNTTSSAYCLVERTVLDNPVTIPAGGIGQVTYTIRFNYPTA